MVFEVLEEICKKIGAKALKKGEKDDKYYIDFDFRPFKKQDIELIQKELDEKAGGKYLIISWSSSFVKELNKAAQRIYFKVFESKEEKEKFKKELEEKLKSDHIYLGEKLDLFHFEEELIGYGLPLFHFNGTIIRNELINFIREVNEELGYKEVFTPHLSKCELWKVSGHYDKYKDRMFIWKQDDEEYGLKPMNCPMHLQIFKFLPRSYKDLPFRIAEFAVVYRKEQSGELHGLTRVYAITQDDHHCILKEDQIEEEIEKIVKKTLEIYEKFGLKDVEVVLSTRPDEFIGDIETWEKAENALKNVLKRIFPNYKIAEKEGAFYGPKIDFLAKDSLNRKWQLTTIQLDFFMPKRFDITYTDKDNKEKHPIMIHFAILGSIERFMGVILEHFKGKLPIWLSPIQVAILPISEKYSDYAKEILNECKKRKIRAEIYEEGTLEYRIRECEIKKIPYIVVVGKKEFENKTLNVRYAGTQRELKINEFLKEIEDKISKRL